MNYTNREVVRRLKQYDMFLNSLNLATNEVQRERICDQLDKIEKQILLETNSEYEEQYMLLLGEEVRFFNEEKRRLHNLISLIVERKKYLEDRKSRHRDVTGSIVELTTFLGEDKLNVFKRRLEIIDKYEKNKSEQESLIKEMKMLDVRLSEASRTVKANTRLNEILENKMISFVNRALDKLGLYALTNKREEILKNYEMYEYVLNLAKDNLKSAKKVGSEDSILECDEMLSKVTTEYSKYNEMVNILKLIDVYDKSVSGYEELLEKRENINEILKNISDSSLYNEIAEELNKEYNTIRLEKQDIDNYESLKEERERKNRILYDIDEENNSKEFKAVIDEFVRNENRIREEQIRKAKREEYQERQKKLLEEQKIEASRVRRQKLIEEARLKEQRERFDKVKELQNNTVINTKKKEEVIPVISDKPVVKEEKINNPLLGKTFDEVVSLDDDFDTDELFENTKIVPNKVLKQEKSIFDDIERRAEEARLEEGKLIVEEPIEIEEKVEDDFTTKEEVVEEVLPLFKGEPKEEVEVLVEDKKEVEEEEVKSKEPSIYDILENNKNIIWKTTDTEVNNSIPVIGNNNLKPEILDNKVVNDNMNFPKLDGKDGEILWKETL